MLQRQILKSTYTIVTFTSIVTFILLLFQFACIVFLEESNIKKESKYITDKLDRILVQRERAIEVAHSTLSTCDMDTLTELRKLIFKLDYIKDIVLFETDGMKIECTAVASELENFQEINTKGFPSFQFKGRDMWKGIEMPYLPGAGKYHLTREADFGIVLDPRQIDIPFSHMTWQLFIRDESLRKSINLYGNLQEDTTDTASSIFNGIMLSYEQCSGTIRTACILVGINAKQLAVRKKELLILALVISLNIGVGLFYLLRRAQIARQSLDGRIRMSLEENSDDFFCHYQPIIDLKNGKIVGCEVLARYSDDLGAITPDVFIKSVESQNLCWKFSEQLFQIAIEDLNTLQDLPRDFRVSFNFFPSDLQETNLFNLKSSKVIRQLASAPFVVMCEILETGMKENQNIFVALQYLRSLGYLIAIDDFGTGHSNLKQLKEIRPDYLKVDKTFTDEIRTSSVSVRSGFFQHILDNAKLAHTDEILECAVDNTQISVLQQHGVKYAQGYLFSKPLTIENLRQRMRENSHGSPTRELIFEASTISA